VEVAQQADGFVGQRGPRHALDDHALATLAIAELYGMTGSAVAKGPAQRALDALATARDGSGGWRRPDEATADPMLTAWAVLSFATARLIARADEDVGRPASLTFDEHVLVDARSWLDAVTDRATGRVAWGARSDAATVACAIVRRILGEERAGSVPIARAVVVALERLPAWTEGAVDMELWYFASALLADGPSESWTPWSEAILSTLLGAQRAGKDRCAVAGSWDPVGPFVSDLGRVGSTALASLVLGEGRGYERRATYSPDRR
jgi:hypothetical protein